MPLDQINRDNFNKLEVAWRLKTDALGPDPEFNFQVTPLDGQRRALHHRRLAPRGRRARRRDRRDAVDAPDRRRQARRGRAAPALGPRPRVLDRRQAGAHRLRHARLPDDCARREDRAEGPVVRQERHRRSQAREWISRSISRPARSDCTPTPIIAKDVIVVGAAHLPGSMPKSRRHEKGYIRGYDARPASGCGSSTPFRCAASSARRRGRTNRPPTPATSACGRR